jgi:hypothetical protein
MKIFVSTALDLEVEEDAGVRAGSDIAASRVRKSSKKKNSGDEVEIQSLVSQAGDGSWPSLSHSLRCVTLAPDFPWKTQAFRRRKHEKDSRPAVFVNLHVAVQS